MTLDSCKIDGSPLDEGNVADVSECQVSCQANFGLCKFFIYDQKEKLCQRFGYDQVYYVRTCSIVGGTPDPGIENCSNDNDECIVSTTMN